MSNLLKYLVFLSLITISFNCFAQSINPSAWSVTKEPIPACMDNFSDSDGDGWGWENNKSCKVGGELSYDHYPSCNSNLSDPDGDGWGWENSTSCKVINLVDENEEPSIAKANTSNLNKCSDNVNKQDKLLSDPNRMGYGRDATGGSNEIIVSNLTQLTSAIKKSNSYIIIDESLAGKTMFFNDTLQSSANNITIDGSCAPGFKFQPSKSMSSGRGILWLKGNNIILHDLFFQGIDYPNNKKNIGAIRVYGKNIWLDKLEATNFDDDFINILVGSDFITTSRIKSYNTHKSIFTFNTINPDSRLTVHTSDLSSTQRSPWVSAGRAHVFNNWIHNTATHGTLAGRMKSQKNLNFKHNGIAQIITEENVYEKIGTRALMASIDSGTGIFKGFLESVNDNINSHDILGNVSFKSKPSLFHIPYPYTAIPNNQVKQLVKDEAGASKP